MLACVCVEGKHILRVQSCTIYVCMYAYINIDLNAYMPACMHACKHTITDLKNLSLNSLWRTIYTHNNNNTNTHTHTCAHTHQLQIALSNYRQRRLASKSESWEENQLASDLEKSIVMQQQQRDAAIACSLSFAAATQLLSADRCVCMPADVHCCVLVCVRESERECISSVDMSYIKYI